MRGGGREGAMACSWQSPSPEYTCFSRRCYLLDTGLEVLCLHQPTFCCIPVMYSWPSSNVTPPRQWSNDYDMQDQEYTSPARAQSQRINPSLDTRLPLCCWLLDQQPCRRSTFADSLAGVCTRFCCWPRGSWIWPVLLVDWNVFTQMSTVHLRLF